MATRLARPVQSTGLRQHLIAKYTDLARRFDRGRDVARFGSPWAVMAERLERREPVEMSGWQVPDEWRPSWLGSYGRAVLEPDDTLTKEAPRRAVGSSGSTPTTRRPELHTQRRRARP